MNALKLDNKKILLIDDDVVVNKVNKYLIESTGIFDSVESKSAPQEALDYIKTQIQTKGAIPGFILVDISMPEIDGFEFIDLIDELFEEEGIDIMPVFVILSSSNFKRDYEQFDKTPAVKKFLSKPLQKEEFEKVLKELHFM
jgi:CheY-like chemotaxis protein